MGHCCCFARFAAVLFPDHSIELGSICGTQFSLMVIYMKSIHQYHHIILRKRLEDKDGKNEDADYDAPLTIKLQR